MVLPIWQSHIAMVETAGADKLMPSSHELWLNLLDSYYQLDNVISVTLKLCETKSAALKRFRKFKAPDKSRYTYRDQCGEFCYTLKVGFSRPEEKQGRTIANAIVLPDINQRKVSGFTPRELASVKTGVYAQIVALRALPEYTAGNYLYEVFVPWLARSLSVIHFAKASGALVVMPPTLLRKEPLDGGPRRFLISPPAAAESRLNDLTMSIIGGVEASPMVREGEFAEIVASVLSDKSIFGYPEIKT